MKRKATRERARVAALSQYVDESRNAIEQIYIFKNQKPENMKTLVKETKRRVYLKFGEDLYSTNHEWSDGSLVPVDITALTDQQAESLKADSGWWPLGDFEHIEQAYVAYLAKMRAASEKRKEEQKMKDSQLDDFWKDVDSRVGMDVCDPFIDRFKGHSFVAYDRGFVWSKTLRAVFHLRNCTASRNYYPKTCRKIFSFGSDLSELESK
jgi:hypothetical protein